MNIVSKEHLVKGRKNEKTQEKIRIKLRFLLNTHSKASIFCSNYSDAKLGFHLENEGFKQAFIIYQSTSIDNCQYYSLIYNNLYFNEVAPLPDQSFIDDKESTNYRLIIAMRKLKKGY